MSKKVAVLMGSDSDLPIVKETLNTLKKLKIFYEVRVISAHRTPKQAGNFASNAKTNGFGVIICAAGKAAHLAGIIAAHTTLPVIGIPIKASTLDGIDALLSTVQMPKGVPVATVAIDGSANAAILAAQILGVYDEEIDKELEAMKTDMVESVIKKNQKLQEDINNL